MSASSSRWLRSLACCSLAALQDAPGAAAFAVESQGDLGKALAQVTAEVVRHGSDHPRVELRVGGRPAGDAALSEYRFEGFVNPRAYLDDTGTLRTQRSPWSETAEDVRAALAWTRRNRTRMLSVVRRKRDRFRYGLRSRRAEADGGGWRPPGYFRETALDVSSWIRLLRGAGVSLSGSYVNLGAADGVGDDPLHAFALDARARGLQDAPKLAVEADPRLCERHRRNLPWVKLACTRVTTQNAKALIWDAFPTAAARDALDILKLDIDSTEAFVVEECLRRARLRPKLILVEVNAAIPPPLQYALLDSPQLRSNYPAVEVVMGQLPLEINAPIAGVSLSYLVRHLAPDYALLEFGSPDAIFARTDIMTSLGRDALDEFEAFEHGWVDVHGFSRQQLRRWHFELDEVAALGELHGYLVKWMLTHLGEVLPFSLSY
eukprot:TRINITY_DN74226_c0_g1_i1.p1 TRINITY_DN74226_c0_g1~~TRINITY_DN74226_c0_g1_i1.p1  ORF type:complete len:496 (+),score=118.72 TRINITY_DN74226_c0_g1_i1:187-1488(+)